MAMKELLTDLDTWRTEGIPVGRAVVVRTFGSAPRPEGATLLVGDDGRLAGSVSGGCVEAAAHEAVNEVRRSGRSRVIRYGISDEQAWDVGLACGGTIDVLVEPRLRDELEAAARNPGRVVITPLPADMPGPGLDAVASDASPTGQPGPGERLAEALLFEPYAGLGGTTGDPATDRGLVSAAGDALLRGRSRTIELGGRSYFIEAFARRPRVVIVGAVQVAIPLVSVARTLGYSTIVIDARPAFATRERFPHADELLVGWADELAERVDLGPDDAVAVLTHDPKLDDPAIANALRRGCRYVGAIGSRRTQADRRERLRAAGLTEEELARLRGPIGLDLGGRDPAETALAIMAEVVAARYGASGMPMRDVRDASATPVGVATQQEPLQRVAQ
jgi:xanthine dehydrogenase accessory factor